MPFKQVASGAIEIALQQAINLSSNGHSLVSELENSTCIIHVQDLSIVFGLHFSSGSVDVTSEEVFSDEQLHALGNQECYVSIALSALPELQQTSRLTKLIKEGRLDFYGDLGVLQKLSGVLAKLDIDIAEILSAYIGDAPTHWLMDTAQKVQANFKQNARLQANAIADYMFDEQPVTVRAIMITNFIDEVRELRADVDRLEARLALLEKHRKT